MEPAKVGQRLGGHARADFRSSFPRGDARGFYSNPSIRSLVTSVFRFRATTTARRRQRLIPRSEFGSTFPTGGDCLR